VCGKKKKKMALCVWAISHNVPLACWLCRFWNYALSSYHKTLLDAQNLMLPCRPALQQAKIMRSSKGGFYGVGFCFVGWCSSLFFSIDL
jgi:hypothetical protein